MSLFRGESTPNSNEESIKRREGKTWTWEYDESGNVEYKREYAYTIGTLGTPADIAAYVYYDQ